VAAGDELPRIAGLQETYDVIRRLGGGGMGSVFLVRHRHSGELRVVKVMRPEIADDPTLRQRFEREARMAEQLHHPNLAQVYDARSVEHAQAFVILEYIEGITFEKVVQARPLVPLRLAVELARQTAEAVAFLHTRSLVHRDITPDNLMLRRERDGAPLVKLIDLGIAKPLTGSVLTAVGSFLGKLWYASPEQLEGGIGDHGAVGPSSDLYSLGMVMYELVTGTFPFTGSTQADAVQAHLFQAPKSFAVSDPGGRLPASLRQLVLHCLEKQPGRRPASGRARARRPRAAMDELRSVAEGVAAALTRLLGPPPEPERRLTQPWAPAQAAAVAAVPHVAAPRAAPPPAAPLPPAPPATPSPPPPPPRRRTAAGPAAAVTPPSAVAREAARRHPRDSRLPFVAAGLLLLAVVAGAGGWWLLRQRDTTGSPGEQAATTGAAPASPSAGPAAAPPEPSPPPVVDPTPLVETSIQASAVATPPIPEPTPTLAPIPSEVAPAAASTIAIADAQVAPRATPPPRRRPPAQPSPTPHARATERTPPANPAGASGRDEVIEIPFEGPARDAGTASSRAASAHLFGTLRSTDGSPIAGATIRLLADAGGPPAVTVSDDDGHYDFAALAPGRYLAEIERAGFVKARSRFTLVIGKQQLNLGLQPQP
jgi:serine/threonine protein kinase